MPDGVKTGAAANSGPVDPANCAATPSAAPLQRLTQAQFTASAKALLQLQVLPALDLPADDKVGPFTANGTSPVTDLSVNQYVAAAEALAAAAAPNAAALGACPGAVDANCVGSLITILGEKIHRRPLTADELSMYTTLAQPYLAAQDPNGAARLVLQALLQSPYFLYRPEFGDPNAQGAVVPLEQHALATRLAFFLTGQSPDDTLLRLATAGQLADTNSLRSQAMRLIQSPAFGNTAARFVSQWLALENLSNVVKDANSYPNFDPAVLAAMQQEVNDFTAYVVQSDDGRIETLLSAPYSVLTDPMFAAYKIAKPTAYAPGQPVQMGNQRAGLLTQAAFLTAHAHPNAQTPVVLRGRVIRENLLCQSMPPPPANVPSLPATRTPNETARQIFADHEASASCAACHTLMDPLGLAFEHFDGVGAWRDTQAGAALDVSGQLGGTPHSNGAFTDAASLARLLAQSSDVQQCVVTQTWRFAQGRFETAQDACSLAQLNASFAQNQHSVRELMLSMVMSTAFRQLATTGAAP